MKKWIALILSSLLVLASLCGCGCAKNESKTETPTQTKAPANADTQPIVPDAERPAVSENKDVVSTKDAPDVVMIQNSDSNVDNITYHLENCPLLKGKETAKVSWELVQMVGLWQCPECNPPRYEDYRNAK